jgi:hypothetical protein
MQALSAAATEDDDAVDVLVDVAGEDEEVVVDEAGVLDEAPVPLLFDPQPVSASAATPTRAAACMDFFTDSSSGRDRYRLGATRRVQPRSAVSI